jgi:hypothetical protein
VKAQATCIVYVNINVKRPQLWLGRLYAWVLGRIGAGVSVRETLLVKLGSTLDCGGGGFTETRARWDHIRLRNLLLRTANAVRYVLSNQPSMSNCRCDHAADSWYQNRACT